MQSFHSTTIKLFQTYSKRTNSFFFMITHTAVPQCQVYDTIFGCFHYAISIVTTRGKRAIR